MDKQVQQLFETTDLTLEQIAEAIGTTYKVVWNIVERSFTKKQRSERKRRNYAKSKTGPLNPMFGKTGDQHHNYIGVIPDGKGYLMVLKPSWYTGRKGSKHVLQHHIVLCEAFGWSEMPAGWVGHHIDQDKTNNDLSNLALMTLEAHSRLHSLERATTSRLAA